jgi:hypothetical protein
MQTLDPPGSKSVPPGYLNCIRDFSVESARANQSVSPVSCSQEDDFDLADPGYEISMRLQYSPNRKMLDTRQRFIIHSAIIKHRNSGVRKGIPVNSKHWYMCGLPSSGKPFGPLLKGGYP